MFLVARRFAHSKLTKDGVAEFRGIGEDPLPFARCRGRIAQLTVNRRRNEMVERVLFDVGLANMVRRELPPCQRKFQNLGACFRSLVGST